MNYKKILAVLFALAAFAGTGSAFAQTPYGMPITLDQAKKAMTAAEAEAKKNNWNMVIAIVDAGGHLTHGAAPNQSGKWFHPVAYSVRQQDNLVLVDHDKCVGCHACVVACPYDARAIPEDSRGYYGATMTSFERVAYNRRPAGVVQKCTMCVHRIDKGLRPACIETCPPEALIFGDLNDPQSAISKVIARRENFQPHVELGTDPNVYYLT